MIKPYVYITHSIQGFHEDIMAFMLNVLRTNVAAYDRQTLPGKLKDNIQKKRNEI